MFQNFRFQNDVMIIDLYHDIQKSKAFANTVDFFIH